MKTHRVTVKLPTVAAKPRNARTRDEAQQTGSEPMSTDMLVAKFPAGDYWTDKDQDGCLCVYRKTKLTVNVGDQLRRINDANRRFWEKQS